MKTVHLFLLATGITAIGFGFATVGCPAPGGSSGSEGEGEGEGEGDVGACEGGAIDDAACLEDRPAGDDPALCDGTDCVDPASLTDGCNSGHAADADGPVLIETELVSSGDDGENCAGDVNTYLSTVFSETGFDPAFGPLYNDEIVFDGGLSYSEDPATGDLLPEADDSVGDGYWLITWYTCGSPGAAQPVWFVDSAGGEGNAECPLP